MVDISAKLIGGPVFLSGDNIGCCISFTNKSDHDNSKIENLAWSSAQIHCSCVINDKLISSTIEQNGKELTFKNDTSFIPHKDDAGSIVFSTKPVILFCDLKLFPGETKSFLYRETLPTEIPPSYRGQLVKYSYKITIGTQRVGSIIKLLRLPLRILVVDGLPDISTCEDSVDLSPSNPFLDAYEKDRDMEPALQVLHNVTARRSANYYNITNSKGKVARFSIFKTNYKLGEDIVGTFDFESSTVPCVQFVVILQCEEIIGEKYRCIGKRERAVNSYNKCSEFCLNLKKCFINLPIPLHITPGFNTDIVTLKWKLHFAFVTSCKPIDETPQLISEHDFIWDAPKSIEIETMVWDLPIQIYPTATLLDMHTPTKSNLSI